MVDMCRGVGMQNKNRRRDNGVINYDVVTDFQLFMFSMDVMGEPV